MAYGSVVIVRQSSTFRWARAMTETASTIPHAFRNRVRATPDSIAYREPTEDGWRNIPWSEVELRVARRRSALATAGLTPGDRVAIFLPNGIEWVVTDLAAMAQGLVTVPVYLRDSADNICHVLRDCGAVICITDTAESWAALGPETDTPDLRNIWIMSGDTATSDDRVCLIPDAKTREDSSAMASDGDRLATIIYTSGTTGPPKGVMLSHKALLWNAGAVARVNRIEPEDVFLSILPLAHAFERSLGWLCPMLHGSTVAYVHSIETLSEDLARLRPTILLAVPRLFERVHDKARTQAGASAMGRWLLQRTVKSGWARHLASLGGRRGLPLADRVFWALAGHRVARRIRAGFGGRLRMVLSGGAPLSEATYRFMIAMEVPLIEGYGLTEAGPAVTGSSLDDRRPGFVGRALPDAETKIGPRQELLVRSPGVMMGYWHNPKATEDTVDDDGWLHTGDTAEIIDDRVRICGRIKDILVLSTGENVNPAPIETAILADPLIEQACVLGDGKPWCAAVVVVNCDQFHDWSEQVFSGSADVNDPLLRAALTERLQSQMDNVPPFARVRSLYIEKEPWSLSSGLITPTLKAKRPKIAVRYADEVNRLYD